VRRLIEEFRTSERRVCGLMEIPRMTYRYQSRSDDTALRERLLALARESATVIGGCGCYWLAIGRRMVSASITSGCGVYIAIWD
jgi:hypothetical protein